MYEIDVTDLEALSLADLRARWTEMFGTAPPKLRTRELLALALAYRLQAQGQGGLPGAAKRRLGELARRFSEDRTYTPRLSISAACAAITSGSASTSSRPLSR